LSGGTAHLELTHQDLLDDNIHHLMQSDESGIL
jgi:hypothetical protein